MAVIVFRCTDCDREIQIIEQPQGLETIGRCVITNKCRGNLYRINRKDDFVVGEFPSDVRGLTNWIQRNVVHDHIQAIAAIEWVVIHNLGVNPTVQVEVDRESIVDGVVTTTRIEIEPQSVTLVDENTLTIQFDRPESGIGQIIARSTAATQSVEVVAESITYLPVTTDGILTIAANLDSLQFPAGSATGTCLVRMYILDQETLDETAFESAVSKNFTATAPVNTSPWSDTDEIFVNGVTYTVLTIDIGDPVTDFDAPSAGTVLFQAGTSTAGFPNDQAPNMVVLLSTDPHNNADKIRNQVFRPDLEVGPAQTLDSFIFANGEYFLDQTKAEKVFPPIYIVDAPQVHPVVPPTPVTYEVTVADDDPAFGFNNEVGSISPSPTTILGGDVLTTVCTTAPETFEIEINEVTLADLVSAGYTIVEWEGSIDGGEITNTDNLADFTAPGPSGGNSFGIAAGINEDWDASDVALVKTVTIR